jgi:hypothetical protein
MKPVPQRDGSTGEFEVPGRQEFSPDGTNPSPLIANPARRVAGSSSVCSVEDCEREIQARGWCRLHYQRWYRRGDPLAVPQSKHLVLPNSLRANEAGARAAAAAQDALASTTNPVNRTVLRLRVAHPDRSLAVLAAMAGMTKDQYAGRLRRALERGSR